MAPEQRAEHEALRRRPREIKGLPRGVQWVPDEDREEELRRARESAYFWWWMFLAESREYRRAVSGAKDEPYAEMAADFGRIRGTGFDHWWMQRGRDLFSERMAIPIVRALKHGDVVNIRQLNEKLVLEIPLTVRRRTIIRQINKLLDQRHDGRELRVMRHSTAQRQLNPDSRMRVPTMALLHRIWVHKKENPDQPLFELGEELRLSPVFIRKTSDDQEDKDYKARCMTIVVQRYLRKAEALIYWAARGKFPCVDKFPRERPKRP